MSLNNNSQAEEEARRIEEERRRREAEIRRQKYIALKGKMSEIRGKLSELTDIYDLLFNSSKEALLIDGKIVCEEKLTKIDTSVNNIIDEIDNVVIPNIDKNI